MAVAAEQREIVAELLWGLDTIGFSESEEEGVLAIEAFFPTVSEPEDLASKVVAELRSLGVEAQQCSASLFLFEPDSWLDHHRSRFREFSIGSTFFIYPPWSSPSLRYPVNIMVEPAMAFGTGTHESTRLALKALVPVVPDAESMVDVGTGSGILTIGAKKLKPSLAVTAFDNDMLAVSTARENLTKNQVGEVRLFVGEPAALRGVFDLLVANLTLEIFKQVADDLIRLGPKRLVLSGFTGEQKESVRHLFCSLSALEVERVWSENDWVCLYLSDEAAIS